MNIYSYIVNTGGLSMKVTMLAENQKDTSNKKLKSEHGLSMLIEINGKNILFDTGSSDLFIENAINMGIDLKKIDTVIISHGHIDHTGGLKKFLELNENARVFMSSLSKEKYYIKICSKLFDIAVPSEIFKKYNHRITFVNNFTKVFDGIFIISGVQHTYPSPRTNKKLFVNKLGHPVQDTFDHEIILAINENNKLSIFTGCSHSGIDNMIETSRHYFPSVPIYAVFGGFHLMGIPFKNLLGESRDNIKIIGNRICKMDVNRVYTCHCTGKKAYKILKEEMNDSIEYFHTGMQVEIS